MSKLKLPLAERDEIARDTLSFRFDLGSEKLPFEPGQHVSLEMTDMPRGDKDEDERTFSIASSPESPHLMVATRMRDSAFKRSLAEIDLGTELEIDGPHGSFVLDPDSDRPVTMFAGGIGVTPFRSMIRHELENGSGRRLTLVWSNRTPEDAPFLDEMQRWSREHDNFRLVATMTQADRSVRGWDGKTGRVDREFLEDVLDDLPAAVCYVAGPPGFVQSVGDALVEAGVKRSDVRDDAFEGY